MASPGNLTVHTASAADRGASPWPLSMRIKLLLWEYAWIFLCIWTPKPFNLWRLSILRVFGTKVHGRPFVHQRARIQIPWNVELYNGSCLGDRANLYSLDRITIGEGAVVAQEAYLCTGTHEFSNPTLPLMTAPITVQARSFIGARAFVLPGVTIGERAVIGACSVVTRSIPGAMVARGNPARSCPP